MDLNHTPNTSSDCDDSFSTGVVSPETGGGFDSSWVKEPSENDVLCGRGGSINSHPGNERFRTLVEKRKRIYLTARFKREKRLIASSIVQEIRALNPSGRFLTRDNKSGKWKDIGDEKARDKTSQALRENAPSIRAEIETEINEQRAEMQRVEEQEAARAPNPSPHPAYNQGWGYPTYYGGPPPPQSYGHHPPPYPGYWGHAPPPHYPPPLHPSPYTQATTSDPYPPPPPKSALQQTAELVASGADSIKQWTQKSFSFVGTGGTVQSSHSADDVSRADTYGSKPIVYVHQDGTVKRRMVKFREDASYTRRHTKRRNTTTSFSGNSLMDGEEGEDDNEPEDLGVSNDSGNSVMNQFANNILSSIGSWDAVSVLCGQDHTDDRVPFPRSNGHEVGDNMEQVPEEEMAVEWEGQEVQLLDDRIGGPSTSSRDGSVDRMPPPARRNNAYAEQASLGFSSIGSCHSWLPDQISATASFFSGGASRGGDSMDMDLHSAGGTENFSTGGSLGGNSLTRVFEHETLEEGFHSPTSNNMSSHSLQQMPSWERNLRSRSPLSIGGDDDESLISKSSSKISENGIPTFPISGGDNNSMNWESRE